MDTKTTETTEAAMERMFAILSNPCPLVEPRKRRTMMRFGKVVVRPPIAVARPA